MPRIQPLSVPKQRWHLLLALLIIRPILVASSTKSPPIDQIWGVTPKVESTPFNVGFGLHHRTNNAAATTVFPRRLVVMGGPASGKGTQCQAIAEKHGLVHLSTGDMLRQAVSAESVSDEIAPHISTIKNCMEDGKLIPDDIVVRLVLDRLRSPDCQKQGWILDGFPRTSNQAVALQNAGIHPDVFLFLSVPDDVAIKRVVGRRQDSLTGKVYHLDWNPPPNDEIAQRLVTRSDDTIESMKQRLKQFRENANAVKACYNNTVEIDGLGTPEEVLWDIDTSLKRVAQGKHRV